MNKYLKILELAIDSFGFLTERNAIRCGGDTSQREGSLVVYAYCALQENKISQAEFDEIKERYLVNYAKLRETCMPGEHRRHIDTSMWYGSRGRMSRDQWTPNVTALGLVGTWKMKLDMILGMAMRGFLFTTNIYRNHEPRDHWKLPDLTAFACWGYVLRWFSPVFWPILLFTDLELLVNSLIWKYRLDNPKNTNYDILNHVISLLQARYKTPTPVSWLSRKILDPEKVLRYIYNYHHAEGPRLDLVAEDFLRDSWK